MQRATIVTMLLISTFAAGLPMAIAQRPVGATATYKQVPRKGGGYYYGKESPLPMCSWPELLYVIENPEGKVTCIAAGRGDDTCTIVDGRATDGRYSIAPREQRRNYTAHIDFGNGTALYNTWNVACSHGRATEDEVILSAVEGKPIDPDVTCGWPIANNFETVLAEVSGGIVEHNRPALVRGTVRISIDPVFTERLSDDVTVALQVYDALTGWHDVATRIGTAGSAPQTFTVETRVAEQSDVRLQLRGKHRCRSQMGGGTYNLQDARIFVETCIPDQSDPSQCLGD